MDKLHGQPDRRILILTTLPCLQEMNSTRNAFGFSSSLRSKKEGVSQKSSILSPLFSWLFCERQVEAGAGAMVLESEYVSVCRVLQIVEVVNVQRFSATILYDYWATHDRRGLQGLTTIIGARVLRPRPTKIIKEYPAPVTALVVKHLFPAYRTIGIGVYIGFNGPEKCVRRGARRCGSAPATV